MCVCLNTKCENCIWGEPCNKYKDKIHCNLLDKSYEKDQYCDNFNQKENIDVYKK